MRWSLRFNSFRRSNRKHTVFLFVYAYYLLVYTANPLNALHIPKHYIILNILRNLLPQILHVNKCFIISSINHQGIEPWCIFIWFAHLTWCKVNSLCFTKCRIHIVILKCCIWTWSFDFVFHWYSSLWNSIILHCDRLTSKLFDSRQWTRILVGDHFLGTICFIKSCHRWLLGAKCWLTSQVVHWIGKLKFLDWVLAVI